mmetsp:Transcript_62715/g.111828  ORF Transcript_62715/g.111828 Transcript_62715/m.111828 type:complete len:236 (-) Transcript_62715:1048-1755(-)
MEDHKLLRAFEVKGGRHRSISPRLGVPVRQPLPQADGKGPRQESGLRDGDVHHLSPPVAELIAVERDGPGHVHSEHPLEIAVSHVGDVLQLLCLELRPHSVQRRVLRIGHTAGDAVVEEDRHRADQCLELLPGLRRGGHQHHHVPDLGRECPPGQPEGEVEGAAVQWGAIDAELRPRRCCLGGLQAAAAGVDRREAAAGGFSLGPRARGHVGAGLAIRLRERQRLTGRCSLVQGP